MTLDTQTLQIIIVLLIQTAVVGSLIGSMRANIKTLFHKMDRIDRAYMTIVKTLISLKKEVSK